MPENPDIIREKKIFSWWNSVFSLEIFPVSWEKSFFSREIYRFLSWDFFHFSRKNFFLLRDFYFLTGKIFFFLRDFLFFSRDFSFFLEKKLFSLETLSHFTMRFFFSLEHRRKNVACRENFQCDLQKSLATPDSKDMRRVHGRMARRKSLARREMNEEWSFIFHRSLLFFHHCLLFFHHCLFFILHYLFIFHHCEGRFVETQCFASLRNTATLVYSATQRTP
jgi:hypothetical protein